MSGSKTKLKFAQAVQELTDEKTLRKITVNDIVEKSHMTRQAFYYHFHDIYELLEWTCAYELFEGKEEADTAEEWIDGLIDRLQEKRRFYRKIFLEFDGQLLEQMLKEKMQERIELDTEAQNTALGAGRSRMDNMEFLKDFLAASCANYLRKWICGTRCESKESMAEHMNYLLGYIRNGYEAAEQSKINVFREKYA